MSPSVTLNRLVRTDPPVFEATYEGNLLHVRLDSSAVMKLEGSSHYRRLSDLLAPPPRQVADAVGRLIEMGQVEPGSEGFVVTVSALDLD